MSRLHLTLIRHGETDWNLERRWQGSTDVPLNATGEDQARRLGERLRAEGFVADVVLSSDLSRARETARLAGELAGFALPETDPIWRERTLGEFEGLTREEIREHHPGEYEAWQADRLGWTPPGGESYLDLRNRVGRALATLRERHAGKRVLLVSHGGCCAAALSWFAPENGVHDTRVRFSNTSVTRVRCRGPEGWELELLNCATHLEG